MIGFTTKKPGVISQPKVPFWTGYLDDENGKHRIMLPIRLTNPSKNKSVMLDALVDTGYNSSMLITQSVADELELNGEEYKFQTKTGAQAAAPFIYEKCERGELKCSIPMTKETDKDSIFQLTFRCLAFSKHTNQNNTRVIVGLRLLQQLKFDVYINLAPIPKIRHVKGLSKILKPDDLGLWQYGFDGGSKFFKKIERINLPEEEEEKEKILNLRTETK